MINEALAAELPVIASDQVGAALDLVDAHKTGFVFAPENVEAWAEGLLRLETDDELHKSMVHSARSSVDVIDVSAFARGVEQLLAQRRSCR